ncbi:dinucleotide-binding enzyme [Mycolicibacterium litorale]|nr:dinucleotide-binding enzyme [Mycolicibacterium litorale]
MKIAIIGAGSVGRALGGAWSGEHTVTYGVRDPGDAKHADLSGVQCNAEAVACADVVVLCTPWAQTEAAIRSCGDLTGRIVLDCTNPLNADATELAVGHTTSGAELVARWAAGARVCKAMNQIGAPMMAHPVFDADPVMFVCADDPAAKDVVIQLVAGLGFDPVDIGDLSLARLLEPFALLWIHLALRCGFGTDFGFATLRSTR